jgi:hypothetical protein
VGKAWLLLKGKERFLIGNNQSANYKMQAMKELEKALVVLNNEMVSLLAIQTILQQKHSYNGGDLSKQLIQKANILTSYSNSIQNAILCIRKSKRLIDIVGIKKYQNTTYNESSAEDFYFKEEN